MPSRFPPRVCLGLLHAARIGQHLAVGGLALVFGLVVSAGAAEVSGESLRVALSWGHRSATPRSFAVALAGDGLSLRAFRLEGAEAGEVWQDGRTRAMAGSGDVDSLVGELRFQSRSITTITNAQSIWSFLLQHTDPGAARRLRSDPAYRPDSRRLTVTLDEQGTRGFSLTVDQLLAQREFWFPEHDLFLAVGDQPTSFAAHQASLAGRSGQRVLDRVAREPEATYSEYAARWADMGDSSYHNPREVPPGQVVGIGWDSALAKFGVDRWAGVRNDYGEVDHFRLSLDFGDASLPLDAAWRGQRLAEGLPILTTAFEKDGVRCEVEQFAFPLDGPPFERRGDLRMVLLEQVRLSELRGVARSVPVRFLHERGVPLPANGINHLTETGRVTLEDLSGQVLLVVEGVDSTPQVEEIEAEKERLTEDRKSRLRTHRLTREVALPAHGTRSFVVRLASPSVPAADRAKLIALDYAASRAATVKFWNDWLAAGAQFEVPDEAVNTLFRASLWHALRLPRRHGAAGPEVKIDLPYSNFAYDQQGTPWPVNQSVYVDYMLYDLRGYHAVSEEEHTAIFRNNQEANGHVGGFANWGVYTPGMLYSIAQHFLLSGDRASFDRLMPATMRALDWCLAEMRRADDPANPARGLVLAPLNDLSHDPRSWAFNQAYFVAGVDLIGRALARIGHPRAEECRVAAVAMRAAVAREFGRASVRSPAVPLADGTWSPYVPCDAQASGRLMALWYPTDVDTGPLHLARLGALDPRGFLTTAMLHDHEDNLLIHQWGMINEPVYNQQATAYLLRDEPKAVIRAFYSMLACAFSHTVFEPVEHRWGWPQYFGPPSTDGAWFELYRRMLVRETDDDELWLAQATPRAWLEDGRRIEIQRAPTYYGAISFVLESQAKAGRITATLDLPDRASPRAVVVRFRHPQELPMRSVQVDGQDWKDFAPGKEWVRLVEPTRKRYVITVRYDPPAP